MVYSYFVSWNVQEKPWISFFGYNALKTCPVLCIFIKPHTVSCVPLSPERLEHRSRKFDG